MSECIDDNVLVEFVDGSLDEVAARRVEYHLARCGSCRRVMASAASPSRLAEAPTAPAGIGAHLGLKAGTRIGRFEICHEIGRGGMGIVFAARDLQLERRVAVKLLHSAASSSETVTQAQQRLVAEARAMAGLDHPNIITVYETGTFRRETYIVMELVDGETLNQWLRRWNRSCATIVAAFRQAGAALAHAHQHGLAHGDFKPENILLDDDDGVRVTDFGLSRRFAAEPSDSSLTDATGERGHTRTVMGTPRYMAPEQFTGRLSDARSDQFSFCVTLYEALYGHHPFAHGTAQSLLKLPREEALAPLRQDADSDGDVPSWLHDALLKGLSPAPDKRYPSMTELLAALEPSRRRSSRSRMVAALVAAMVAVCSIGYALGSLHNPHPRAERVESATSIESTAGGEREPTMLRFLHDFVDTRGTPHADESPFDADRAAIGDRQQAIYGHSTHIDRSSLEIDELLGGVVTTEIERVEERIARDERWLRILYNFQDRLGVLAFGSPSTGGGEPKVRGKSKSVARARTKGGKARRSLSISKSSRAGSARSGGLTGKAVARRIKSDQRWRDIEVCFSEWHDRQPRVKASLTARLLIRTDGSAVVIGLRGLRDKVVRKCVSGALEAMRFPTVRRSTVIDIGFRGKGNELLMTRKLVR